MTIHKLTPLQQALETSPLDVSLSFGNRSHDFTDLIVRARAVRAFSSAATRFPIYRLVRCAARAKLEPLFDDIAMHSGLDAHRMEAGHVLLEGPGAFVSTWGVWKKSYSTFVAHVWADSPARAEEVRETLLKIVGERRVERQMFVINWQFTVSDGSLSNATFEEMPDEPLLDEAYPSLGEPVDSFVRRYLDARETVLVLQGMPGTGKTRLVRAILGEISRRKGESAQVMYTVDRRALENDEIFVDFITGSSDAFVIEDADHILMARANGNINLHRFLAVADGVVRAQGRKIIFTTNLPNLGDIDEALLRPGRCFASVCTRALKRDEAERLIVRLCDGDTTRASRALETALPEGSRSTSLASVFRACEVAVAPTLEGELHASAAALHAIDG